MAKRIIVGIDVGTHTTRVVVTEISREVPTPTIIGIGQAPSRGLRHGYITNQEEATRSIRRALDDAEKNSGITIRSAYISIGGISVDSETTFGSAIISKADGEVTNLDVSKAIAEAEENITNSNRRIIDTIPLNFKLDGKEVLGRPEGMRGVKLEVKVLFVTCLAQHLEDLVLAVSDAEVEVLDVIAAPLAAGGIALSERQRTTGCMLVNIGAETVSLAVYENNKVISLHVFSIGSTDITNDIALGLKIPLEEAESIKVGTVISNYPRRKIDEIIEARLSDIFELIENHLKKIKRSGLLPAGVIITGGGAHISIIEELSKSSLKLPSKLGNTEIASSRGKIRDSSWFVVYGLCVLGALGNRTTISDPSMKNMGRNIRKFFSNLVKQLLP